MDRTPAPGQDNQSGYTTGNGGIDSGAGTQQKEVPTTGKYNVPYTEQGGKVSAMDGRNIVDILRSKSST